MKQRESIMTELASLLERLALQTERILSTENPHKLDIDLAKDHLRRIYEVFDDLLYPVAADDPIVKSVESEAAPEETETAHESQGPPIMEPPALEVEPKVEAERPEPVIETEAEPELVAPEEQTEASIEEAPAATTEDFDEEHADQEEPTPQVSTKKEEPSPLATEGGSSSLYEKLSSNRADHSIGARLGKSKIGDLRKAIGINDKFLFSKELFGGNITLYEETINHLNEATDFDAAKKVLDNLPLTKQWSIEDPSFILFMEYIERRHS